MKTINDVAEEEIIANPTDNFLKLKYADLLEDQGNSDLAAAYRYCGENDKHPRHMIRNYNKKGDWFVWYKFPGLFNDKDGWDRRNFLDVWEDIPLRDMDGSKGLNAYPDTKEYVDLQSFQKVMEWLSLILLRKSIDAAEELTSSMIDSATLREE